MKLAQDIILRPVITEESMAGQALKKYTLLTLSMKQCLMLKLKSLLVKIKPLQKKQYIKQPIR